MLLHASGEICRMWEKDGRYAGEETPPVIQLPARSPQPTHSLATCADLNLRFYHFLILQTYFEVSLSLFKFIYANAAIWNSRISMKTFVWHRIWKKTRRRNRFINRADMQIHGDELQIPCDKVSSVAGCLGRLLSSRWSFSLLCSLPCN